MNKRNATDKPPESVEEKIVNFLGIKQRWWRTTSLLHAVLIGLYSLWYLIFDVAYVGRVSEVLQGCALHLIPVSGLLMLGMLVCIHLGAFLMMIHDRYREWRDGQIRAAKEAQHAAEEAKLAAEETARTAAETIAQLQEERAAQQAWNERRLHALETGVPFDEPMPNGTDGAAVEQVRQEQAAYNAWFERRIAAAEKGEPFDEPPPNGTP